MSKNIGWEWKKKTDGKATDHEKKKTPIANKEKDQNKMLPGKTKLKKQKNDGEEMDSNDNELLKKTMSCGPWNNKRKGNAWQQRWSSGDQRNMQEKGCG
jgi:hypothetical protein